MARQAKAGRSQIAWDPRWLGRNEESCAEALAFGFGVAFLLFGYPWMRAAGPATTRLTRAAHLSIAWILLNWWSHDSFHVANGVDLRGLLMIEYGYHITLMTAGVIAAAWFMTIIRQRQPVLTQPVALAN